MRFPWLCIENYAIDGDHLRECSRPYARSYGCICAYARLQSMMVYHTTGKTHYENFSKEQLTNCPSVYRGTSEAEGVPNEVRRKSCKLIYYALRL